MAELDGERQTQQVFALRSMASGAAFHRAYPRATQQAFLEAHELAIAQGAPATWVASIGGSGTTTSRPR